ncbi:MAG: DUF1015 domain-containing protein [Myxococcales bacterium]|nr:DUF1015 domain-containing protein [Myxococcales bacterium]
MKFEPLRGVLPRPEKAAAVAAPPYDVVSSAEARVMAQGNPDSFLFVNKPEIALPENTNPYDLRVYEAGKKAFLRLVSLRVMQQDPLPAFYVYEQRSSDHCQRGIVGTADVSELDDGKIKKHELTRQDKEDDRTRHTDMVGINAGPVFLTYRSRHALDDLMERQTVAAPTLVVTRNGVTHQIWRVQESAIIDEISKQFSDIDAFYIADGHHRAASASRTCALRKSKNPHHDGTEPYNGFLAVAFSHNQLRILPYNRLVTDLGGLDDATFMNELARRFDVTPAPNGFPPGPKTVCMYLNGQWTRISVRSNTIDWNDPVARLDVSWLQTQLLAGMLNIVDPRRDERIDFLGGIEGTHGLMSRVDSGQYKVAFSLAATTMEDLITIADANEIMPPKSTWFEPKLLSGLVVRLLDPL